MITERMRSFLRKRLPDGPCLVIDLDVVREKYREFERAMPETRIFYAVKANPAPEILSLLANLGSSFDAASVAEIEMALLAGITGERISFGNTVKKKNDISRAYQLGVSLFTVDSVEEVEKIAQAAPRARVFCRILADGAGAEWPLSRKFGCSPAMAIEVLRCAKALGLAPYGVGFHVGSQQTSLTAWNKALVEASLIFRVMAERGIELSAVNLGGGFPAKYLKQVPDLSAYAQTIRRAVADCFGNKRPDTIIEPGRGLVGDAGVIRAEVVLVSRKDSADPHRWVFLDIGKFGGLAETMEEAIRYPIVTRRDDDTKSPCIVAGPTCDSADVLYEKEPYPLPDTLAAGDEVMIDATGAYTASYSTNGFNGFPPLAAYII